MGDAALSLSTWLSALDGPELPFIQAGDSLWSPPFAPTTPSVGHVSIQASDVKIMTVP